MPESNSNNNDFFNDLFTNDDKRDASINDTSIAPDVQNEAEQAVQDQEGLASSDSGSVSASTSASSGRSSTGSSSANHETKESSASDSQSTTDSESSSESSEANESVNSSFSSSSSSQSSSASVSSVSQSSFDDSYEKQVASLHAKQAKDFMASHDLSGKNDPPVVWLMNKSMQAIKDYSDVAQKHFESQKPLTKAEFKAQMKRLNTLPSNFADALIGVWAEYNRSVVNLKNQIDDLKEVHKLQKKYTPRKEMHMLIRWVKTGVPSQMEKDFYRLDKVANDPRFEDFLNGNSLSTKVPVPSQVTSQYHSLSEESSVRASVASSSSSSKKGGH